MSHWIDYDLYTEQILETNDIREKLAAITGNLHEYAAPLISAENQYSLVLNLYACADNPHIYRLIGDIHVFPLEKLLRVIDKKDISPAKLMLKGGIQSFLGEASTYTQHNPPPGPNPPAPIGTKSFLSNTNFTTIGTQYNLIKNQHSISIGLGQK